MTADHRQELVERVARAIALSDYPGEALRWPEDFGPGERKDYRDNARAAIAAAQSDGVVEAERAIRITVWNFLKDRGAKDEACYPIIEGAVTSFRAALPAPAHPSTPSSEER